MYAGQVLELLRRVLNIQVMLKLSLVHSARCGLCHALELSRLKVEVAFPILD